ncbi:MAG: FecR family protein [Bacteroidales bacterium]|nr:FecR family protein [Bacteroidales bacterium]
MKVSTIRAAILLVGIVMFGVGCNTTRVSTGNKPEVIVLPDGSSMILNKHSEVEYVINDKMRNVELSGEAFFNIAKAEIPFEVHTDKGVITVLGTEFNVRSEDDEFEVEVDKGLVEVEIEKGRKKLRKGERVIYDDVNKLLKKGKAEFKHHIWTDDFKHDMRRLGKDIEKEGKKLGKEIKKISKDLKIKL